VGASDGTRLCESFDSRTRLARARSNNHSDALVTAHATPERPALRRSAATPRAAWWATAPYLKSRLGGELSIKVLFGKPNPS